MVTPSVGAVILVPFPFSDLSQAKLRPAVVLAAVGKNDWILCQKEILKITIGTVIDIFRSGIEA